MYLSPQLSRLASITKAREKIWKSYEAGLATRLEKRGFQLIKTPEYNTSNFHLFAFLVDNKEQRDRMLEAYEASGIQATSHYAPLHTSPYGKKYRKEQLPMAEKFAECIVRLPIWYNMTDDQVDNVISSSQKIFGKD